MTDWSAPAIDQRRQQYATTPLSATDLDTDPVKQFWAWFADADANGVVEPHAMVVSTVDAEGAPDSRVVLCRGVTSAGLVLYTNYDAPKSRHLDVNPAVAANFAWLEIHRQVRVRGAAHRMSVDESDAYFASRPRASQLGAWASAQSQPLDRRSDLEAAFVEVEQRFTDTDVPRPPNWGGWRIVPTEWEFWQGRPNRLHDRFVYRDLDPDGRAQPQRLAP